MEYFFEIDFEDASLEWNKNKARISPSMYIYRCDALLASGNRCRRIGQQKNHYLCFLHKHNYWKRKRI